jgi:Fe-S cluster biosynthesis and repair protein YggX
VLLRCLEDLDEPSIISTEDIIDTLDLLDRHGLPQKSEEKQVQQICKELYKELLESRAHLLNKNQVSYLNDLFKKLHESHGS